MRFFSRATAELHRATNGFCSPPQNHPTLKIAQKLWVEHAAPRAVHFLSVLTSRPVAAGVPPDACAIGSGTQGERRLRILFRNRGSLAASGQRPAGTGGTPVPPTLSRTYAGLSGIKRENAGVCQNVFRVGRTLRAPRPLIIWHKSARITPNFGGQTRTGSNPHCTVGRDSVEP
jgi:hypothetical protein